MYSTVLIVHSWIRWIALGAVVGTLVAALRRHASTADRWSLAAMATLDLQMLLGLILYLVVSPNMQAILANFGGAMTDPTARFWAVEHIASMFAAVIAAHVGRVLARKAPTPEARCKRLAASFGLVVILIALGMPWPGRPGGRPLFRI
jgi:heme A synthase